MVFFSFQWLFLDDRPSKEEKHFSSKLAIWSTRALPGPLPVPVHARIVSRDAELLYSAFCFRKTGNETAAQRGGRA
jgi:hypothetical protein